MPVCARARAHLVQSGQHFTVMIEDSFVSVPFISLHPMSTAKECYTMLVHERLPRTFEQVRSDDEREEQAGPIESMRCVVVEHAQPIIHTLDSV